LNDDLPVEVPILEQFIQTQDPAIALPSAHPSEQRWGGGKFAPEPPREVWCGF
jgi:hypothetical protein